MQTSTNQMLALERGTELHEPFPIELQLFCQRLGWLGDFNIYKKVVWVFFLYVKEEGFLGNIYWPNILLGKLFLIELWLFSQQYIYVHFEVLSQGQLWYK